MKRRPKPDKIVSESQRKKSKVKSIEDKPCSTNKISNSLKSKSLECSHLTSKDVESLNIKELLALGENEGDPDEEKQEIEDSNSDSSDFEVVEEAVDRPNTQSIDITLDPGVVSKKRKKDDPDDILKREIQRIKKEIQILVHKVSILCWLGHLRYVNSLLNSPELLALAMSLVTSKNCYPPKRADIKYLEIIVSWFCRKISLSKHDVKNEKSILDQLCNDLECKTCTYPQNVVFMFVVILRMLGLQCRLVMSLQVLPLKPESTSKESENKPSTSSKTSSKKLKVTDEGDESKYFGKKNKKSKKDEDAGVSTHFPEHKPKKNETKSDIIKLPIMKFSGKTDIWTEVFVEAEEKWICVDVLMGKIHCVSDIISRASQPITYVIACNNNLTMKDVTQRYATNWYSVTKKLRVNDEWWKDTLRPFLPVNNAQNREEDEDLARQLTDQPLPSSVSQFKGHPLYVLKRHLLKYEGIYPANAPPLGYIRGEAVYARECVHVLRSRENWHKDARVVKRKEDPYKIVKSRTKLDKMSGQYKSDLPLELFGRWQTEEYKPPTAVDGKVPRNEYGNVDLFKPCMLPHGTVHLKYPGLMRIAKKLNIDCANAMVGFDFHSGGCHAVFDGVVVCEEYKDILIDAWNEEEEESVRKTEEKREKRIYENWKKLIRGLLIREKLKLKYCFGNEDTRDNKPSTSNKR